MNENLIRGSGILSLGDVGCAGNFGISGTGGALWRKCAGRSTSPGLPEHQSHAWRNFDGRSPRASLVTVANGTNRSAEFDPSTSSVRPVSSDGASSVVVVVAGSPVVPLCLPSRHQYT